MTDEKTDPGFGAKAHSAALKAQEAARKANAAADPYADSLLDKVKGSSWTPIIIIVIVLALIGFGLWLAK